MYKSSYVSIVFLSSEDTQNGLVLSGFKVNREALE